MSKGYSYKASHFSLVCLLRTPLAPLGALSISSVYTISTPSTKITWVCVNIGSFDITLIKLILTCREKSVQKEGCRHKCTVHESDFSVGV